MSTINKPQQDMNLMKLMAKFGTDEACREYMEHIRWGYDPRCPRCNSDKVSRHTARDQFDCSSCNYRFSVMSGTIFHDTKLPLPKWFAAIYLMIESRKGISANQMKRTIDVSYKTAWYLCHRIRYAMAELNAEQLYGTIEVDETYVGGTVRGKGSGYRGNKATVVGAVQRDGEIRLGTVGAPTREELHAFIRQHVAPDSPLIYTDAWQAYRGVADGDTEHAIVDHSKDEWVRGDVHTNTVESVWSLLKRSIIGSYHKVSIKHIDAYLDELEWRFNNRENPYLFRDTLSKLLSSENIEYKELTALRP